MLRRLFWIAVGAWLVVRLQRAAAKVTPAGLLDQVATYVRHLGSDVRASLSEGRRTTREVEATLHHAPARLPAIDVTATARNPAGEIAGRR